jgi:Integron-associated effector binding protein
MRIDRVERDDIQVLCLRCADDPAAFPAAWAQLEGAIGSLHGRRFYGAFTPSVEYRACVERTPGDDADALGLGLEPWTLPGGTYARTRLRGEPPEVYGLIAPAFEELLAQSEPDPSRPSIEHYRRRDEIDLLLPVK